MTCSFILIATVFIKVGQLVLFIQRYKGEYKDRWQTFFDRAQPKACDYIPIVNIEMLDNRRIAKKTPSPFVLQNIYSYRQMPFTSFNLGSFNYLFIVHSYSTTYTPMPFTTIYCTLPFLWVVGQLMA